MRRRGDHDPPAVTPALIAQANAARTAAYERRREVAHALYQGRLGFIELRNLARSEQAISHMRLRLVLAAMQWDTSRLTEWRMRSFTCHPAAKLGQLGANQWARLVSAWPMPDRVRMAACLTHPTPPGCITAAKGTNDHIARQNRKRRNSAALAQEARVASQPTYAPTLGETYFGGV